MQDEATRQLERSALTEALQSETKFWHRLSLMRLLGVILTVLALIAYASEGWLWALAAFVGFAIATVLVFRRSERVAVKWNQLQTTLRILDEDEARIARRFDELPGFQIPDEIAEGFDPATLNTWQDLGATGEDGLFRLIQSLEAPGSGVRFLKRFDPTRSDLAQENLMPLQMKLLDAPELELKLRTIDRAPERYSVGENHHPDRPSQRWRSLQFKPYQETVEPQGVWKVILLMHQWVFPCLHLAAIVLLLLASFIMWMPVRTYATLALVVGSGINWMLYILLRLQLQKGLEVLDQDQLHLRKLRRVLEVWEHHPQSSTTASEAAMKQLDRLTQAQRFRNSGLIHLFAVMLGSWDAHLLASFNRWRERYGAQLDGWVTLWQDLDIALSLNRIQALNSQTCWPERIDGTPTMNAQQMMHPLIPESRVVGNDLGIRPGTYIITGSNMSGKSTFLRTLGLSILMAQAGCPVCAVAFRYTPMRIFSSIRIADQLSEGVSSFYAEILRIQSMVHALGDERPTLLLIDEIFHGTNAADRLYGAVHALRKLRGEAVMTLVTTHDEALCNLEEDPDVKATNYHFTDEERDGRLFFDYRIKKGRALRTNARTLLKLAGLVED